MTHLHLPAHFQTHPMVTLRVFIGKSFFEVLIMMAGQYYHRRQEDMCSE
jgi:hypothetical protein